MRLDQHVGDMVALLTAAGVPATADGRNLNPPGVLVKPPALAYRFKGGWEATWTAYAAVGDLGHTDALGVMGELLEAVQAALGGAVKTARPADLFTEDGAQLPAYELTWTDRIC